MKNARVLATFAFVVVIVCAINATTATTWRECAAWFAAAFFAIACILSVPPR